MTLTFIEGQRVAGKLEVVHHSALNWHQVSQTFTMVDYVKEITANKSCDYDE